MSEPSRPRPDASEFIHRVNRLLVEAHLREGLVHVPRHGDTSPYVDVTSRARAADGPAAAVVRTADADFQARLRELMSQVDIAFGLIELKVADGKLVELYFGVRVRPHELETVDRFLRKS